MVGGVKDENLVGRWVPRVQGDDYYRPSPAGGEKKKIVTFFSGCM